MVNDHTAKLDYSSLPAGGSLPGSGYLNSLSRVREAKSENNGNAIIEEEGLIFEPVPVERPPEE